MAIVKIKPVKTALRKRLEYIQRPSKTDEKMLVSSFGCSYETADIEFEQTLSKAMEKGNNLAHHLIQSFAPGECSPERAHEIGKRLADAVLHGRHEYVLSTHIDRGHVHNHILFCAASFIDYKKYVSNKKSYYEIRDISDKLCEEYGLSKVIPSRKGERGFIEYTDGGERKTRPAKIAGKSYAEYAADRDGGSWKSKLKFAVDAIIPQSKDFEDFLKRLETSGYEIKRGKYISVRAQGQERFTRTKTLGADYTEDAIAKRISGEYIRVTPPQERGDMPDFTFDAPESSADATGTPGAEFDIPGSDADEPDPIVDRHDIVGDWRGFGANTHGSGIDTELPPKPGKSTYSRPAPAVNLIADIENCVKAQQNVGFTRWQKIRNLKEAANTLNFLTENNLMRYPDLEAKAAEVADAFDRAADALKAAEKRLADMAALMKRIADYQSTKPVYDGMKSASDKTAYRREHESAIIVYEAAVKALKKHAGGDGKLPNPAKLQTEYTRLMDNKNRLRAEYGMLKRQAKNYGVVLKNVDSILNPGVEQRARGKDRGVEL